MAVTVVNYHRAASYDRHRMDGHFLDWFNQPDVYKEYPGLPVFPLPPVRHESSLRLSQAVYEDLPAGSPAALSLEQHGQILDLAYGLPGRSLHSGREFHYRVIISSNGKGVLYGKAIEPIFMLEIF